MVGENTLVTKNIIKQNLQGTQVLTAEEANIESGLSQPPYKSGTAVTRFRTQFKQKFVRVFDNKPEGSGRVGSWIMKEKDIEGLNPKQIQQK